jgi:hypothetical protein
MGDFAATLTGVPYWRSAVATAHPSPRGRTFKCMPTEHRCLEGRHLYGAQPAVLLRATDPGA